MTHESWLRLENENHDEVAEAIMCCQGYLPVCFSGGFCAYEGDCFRSDYRAYMEAARTIEAASKDKSQIVKNAMREAAAHLRMCAAAATKSG